MTPEIDAFELSSNPEAESGYSELGAIVSGVLTLWVHAMQTDMLALDTSEAILDEFQRYLALSEDMVAMSTKEALVKTARILAMQAAHYASKYGEEPLIDLGKLLTEGGFGEDSAVFLRDGAKTFVGVLGVVAGGLLREDEDTMQ